MKIHCQDPLQPAAYADVPPARAHRARMQIAQARTVVIKVGSALMACPTADTVLTNLCAQVAALYKQDKQVVLISSGAIALGMQRLGYSQRPDEVAALQALAACGQPYLMLRWQKFLDAHALQAAQVLLTAPDLQDAQRRSNAHKTLLYLKKHGLIPVINENDSVVTDEICFTDNDALAAQTAVVTGAQALVLLTDVAGVFPQAPTPPAEQEPGAPCVFDAVEKPLPALWAHPVPGLARGAGTHGAPKGHVNRSDTSDSGVGNSGMGNNGLGKGGMASKLAAAFTAAEQGIVTVIASGTQHGVLADIFAGNCAGTVVVRQ